MRDESLWLRLQAIDLLSVDDLVLPTSGYFGGRSLPDHVKLELIEELRRFLYLLAASKEALVPSPFVALALQCFQPLAMTRLRHVLGQRHVLLTPKMGSAAFQPSYRRAMDLRAMEFGAADPEHIWPQPLSLKLQLFGWGALAAGVGTGIAERVGHHVTVVPLVLLLVGGFIRFTEGPWPPNLPFRKSFVAKLEP